MISHPQHLDFAPVGTPPAAPDNSKSVANAEEKQILHMLR
jgi:hypothetical protein